MKFRLITTLLICCSGEAIAAQNVTTEKPIISDEEMETALPSLDDAPLESIENWQKEQEQSEDQSQPQIPALQDGDAIEILPDPPLVDQLLDDPLQSIDIFDAEPPPAPTEAADDRETRSLRYALSLAGLEAAPSGENSDVLRAVRSRFSDLSELNSTGSAENRASLRSRARSDQQLLLDILNSEGFFDAEVTISAAQPTVEGDPVQITLTATPGRRYFLGSIAFETKPVVPTDLISSNFVPKTGDPIVADVILAAEANIAVVLPQNGYPFAKTDERDILLDGETGVGDYTLPVDTGERSYFGTIRTKGNLAFDADHVALLRRFREGELYDSRDVDDLRAALVATGLLSTVSVEPVQSEGRAADGTAIADLLVRQVAGPPRTLAASAGYGTGQGFRAEGSWTHRNLFPPEGSLSVAGILGTQEQALSLAFARANAGRRDRNVELSLSALRNDYDAFEAFTGRLAGQISYVSTPIWQKKFTYSFGFELLGSYEDAFDFTRGARNDRIYYVAALPGQVGFDRSNDLLNPTKGFRLNLKLSPEASLGSGSQFYLRSLLEGTYYYPVTDALVVAGRARVGAITGAERASIAPSRRYYGGGGGSVRGFGFQELGPKDPNNDPIGGRSLNEAAVEARYRFGNFGVVGFVDAGQVYESSLPKFDDWRFGVGIGGRFYTNFGPVRLDVATPINKQSGESRISVYVSIGQAF